MADHDHYTDCHRHHMACALLKIWDLEKEVQRLTTQLQYERTGHLVAPSATVYWDSPSGPRPVAMTPVPCADIEPPKIATHSVVLPTDARFTHHGEEPPSATP